MNDPIKEFVKLHRAGFDDLRPSPDVFTKIQLETALVKHASKRGRIYRLSSWAIAASVLIGLCIYIYDNPRENFAVNVISKNTKTIPKLKEEAIRRHEKRVSVTFPVSVKQNEMVVRKSKKRDPYTVNLAGSSSTNVADEILSCLSNELSSGTRIRGLQNAGKLSAISPALMKTIVQCATHDPSSNVRLAAIQVIISCLNQPDMKSILKKIFIVQDDPFVQTELIDVIAATAADKADPGIKEKLISLTENDTTAAFVKDRAYTLLLKH